MLRSTVASGALAASNSGHATRSFPNRPIAFLQHIRSHDQGMAPILALCDSSLLSFCNNCLSSGKPLTNESRSSSTVLTCRRLGSRRVTPQ